MADATLSVNLSALRANYQLLKNRHAKKNIAAVVKANAYGLGVDKVSQTLAKEGCQLFFVATLDEAVELRAILPDTKIAVFNGIFPGEEKEYAAQHIIPVVNSPEQYHLIQKTHLPYIVHVDTGMTRLGLSYTELQTIAPLATKDCLLLMSHLACANNPTHPKNTEQLARLQEARTLLPNIPVSFVNSSGHFLPEEYHFNSGRPGCALYGITPIAGENPMAHVATLSAPILQIRTCDRNETVGYGATYPIPKGGRLAITGLGYADGYFRLLSNQGHAYLAGYKVPFAGRVSMDMIALDISSIPENKLTDKLHAEFINEQQDVNAIAEQCSTIGYEIFTRIGRRVKRVYY